MTGLFGAMAAPLPVPSPALFDLLEAIFALDRDDQKRVALWVRRYVNRWGGVPFAASQRASQPDRQARENVEDDQSG